MQLLLFCQNNEKFLVSIIFCWNNKFRVLFVDWVSLMIYISRRLLLAIFRLQN